MNKHRGLRSILSIVTLAAVAGVSASCASSENTGSTDDTVTVGTYPNNMITISLDIAERQGFFDEEGLTVETIDIAKGPEGIAGLIGGSNQFTWATPATFIPAVEQGQNVVAVPPFMDLDYGIYVPEDSNIQTVDDLAGRNIGVNALGGAVQSFAEQVLDANGMSPEDVQFVASGASISQLPALQNGQLDATSAAYGSMLSVRDAGLPVRLIASTLDGTGGEYGDSGLASFWATTTSMIEDSPGSVEKFCRAVTKATDWLADEANKDEAIALIEDVTRTTTASATDLWEKERTFYEDVIDEERWRANIEMTTGQPDSSRPFDESVYACS